MIHRMDPPADPAAEPMPERDRADARPARATSRATTTALRLRDQVGRRARGRPRGRRAPDASTGRNGTDFTPRYPEVRAMADALGARAADPRRRGGGVRRATGGRASSGSSRACTSASDSAVRRRMRDVPVTYVAFDLLWLEGHSTLALPYRDRRRLLAEPRARGPELAHARAPRGRRRGPARGQRGAGPRGHRGQAARLARTSRAGARALDQGQEPPRPRTW